jgi:hypothetical protein
LRRRRRRRLKQLHVHFFGSIQFKTNPPLQFGMGPVVSTKEWFSFLRLLFDRSRTLDRIQSHQSKPQETCPHHKGRTDRSYQLGGMPHSTKIFHCRMIGHPPHLESLRGKRVDILPRRRMMTPTSGNGNSFFGSGGVIFVVSKEFRGRLVGTQFFQSFLFCLFEFVCKISKVLEKEIRNVRKKEQYKPIQYNTIYSSVVGYSRTIRYSYLQRQPHQAQEDRNNKRHHQKQRILESSHKRYP